MACIPFCHVWEVVEAIGGVWTYRCKVKGCPAVKTRLRPQ